MLKADISKPPIAPPNRDVVISIFSPSGRETKDSIIRSREYREYLDNYSTTLKKKGIDNGS